jgi:DivIVA domain-containing protein
MSSVLDEIREVRFRTIRRNGYDPRDVDDFLDRMASEVSALATENERLRAENQRLSGQFPP